MAAVTTAVAAVGAVAVAASSANKQAKAADRANQTAEQANARAADIADRQQTIADEQWQNYKNNYLPLEQDYLEQSKNYASLANQERAATTAAADTEASFSSAKDQLNKTPGLNPNSQQYLREVNRLGITEAAASAANQTTARQKTSEMGAAMLKDAAAMGKGVSGNAVATLQGASSAASGVASSAMSNASGLYGRAQSSAGGVGQMIGGLNQSGAFKTIGNAVGGMFSAPAANNPSAVGGAQPYMPDTNVYTPTYSSASSGIWT